jgi:solute carrier family 25, member 44
MNIFYLFQKVRQKVKLFTDNVYIMAFAGGGFGSIIAQTLSVPIDIISQHMMLSGQKKGHSVSSSTLNPSLTNKPFDIKELDRIHIPDSLRKASPVSIAKYISKEIYKNENIKGFYRGYILSTFLVSLNSALWWPFYYFYQGN